MIIKLDECKVTPKKRTKRNRLWRGEKYSRERKGEREWKPAE